ncbi:MAG: ABC transporter permease [Betaproteobacteria bacterium]|nr:MAG: ABC transporter permease [Betaproteobacteria bacterium]
MSRFSLPRTLLVATKEFADLLRDRKSVFWALFAVAISGPLVIGILYFVTKSVTERIEKTVAPIVNAQFAPDFARFLERRGIKIEADPTDYEARVKRGDLDAVIVIDMNFAENLAQGRPAKITLVTESSRDRSAPIASRLAREIRGYSEQIGNERMILRGVSPSVARPVQIDELDLSTAEQRGARLLQIMSFYALFAGLMGAIAAALDVTAGERERQTLEPLLTTPVSTLELAIGKWLAVSGVNLLAVTMSLVGFWITLSFVPLGKLGIPFNFGWREFSGFMAVLIPFAFMVPAVLLVFGSTGKTAKEAQSSLSMGVSLVGLLPLMSFLRQSKAPWWDAWVPVNGQYAVLSKVLRAESIPALDWAAMLAVPVAVCAAAIVVFSKRLGDEKLLAGR